MSDDRKADHSIDWAAARKNMARIAAEWGYKCCERGMNIQEMLIRFEELYDAKSPEVHRDIHQQGSSGD